MPADGRWDLSEYLKGLIQRGRHFSRLLRSRVVRISGSDARYTMFRGSVKGTGYPLH